MIMVILSMIIDTLIVFRNPAHNLNVQSPINTNNNNIQTFQFGSNYTDKA